MALGAGLLLAVGGIAAEARPMSGGGGGGGVRMGMHPGGGMGGRAFRGNPGSSFRGNSFAAGPRMGRMNRGFYQRGPGGRNFARGPAGRDFARSPRGRNFARGPRGRNFARYNHRHHRRGRFIAGYPYFYDYGYGYDGYYADSCGYYYRRAIATGSPYWWNRYQDCEYAG